MTTCGGGGGGVKMMSSPFSVSHNVQPLWLGGSTLQTHARTHALTVVIDGQMVKCMHTGEREKTTTFECESLELCLLVIISMMYWKGGA